MKHINENSQTRGKWPHMIACPFICILFWLVIRIGLSNTYYVFIVNNYELLLNKDAVISLTVVMIGKGVKVINNV